MQRAFQAVQTIFPGIRGQKAYNTEPFKGKKGGSVAVMPKAMTKGIEGMGKDASGWVA